MNENLITPENLEKQTPSTTSSENESNAGKWSIIFFILFLILGLINNLGYVLILTGSAELSKDFHNDNLSALYLMSLILCSSLTKLLNSAFCLRVSYTLRVGLLSLYFLSGYISLYFILTFVENNPDMKSAGFYLSLIPSFIMGTGSAFGEATVLGYLRNFPHHYISGWSSGTGLAGVAGALLTLIFKLNNIKTKTLFITVSPIALIYFIGFFVIQILFKKYTIEQETNQPFTAMKMFREDVNSAHTTTSNKKLSKKNFCIALAKGKRYILNLAAVYFLEYCILSGFCERATKMNLFTSKNNITYELFSLAYQIGVFISRSSLCLMKMLKYAELLTILQAVNWVIWFILILVPFISSIYIAFGHLIFVGFMGGGAYVLCYFCIYQSEEIAKEYKELCVNIASMFNDIGIFGASLVNLLLANTIMKI